MKNLQLDLNTAYIDELCPKFEKNTAKAKIKILPFLVISIDLNFQTSLCTSKIFKKSPANFNFCYVLSWVTVSLVAWWCFAVDYWVLNEVFGGKTIIQKHLQVFISEMKVLRYPLKKFKYRFKFLCKENRKTCFTTVRTK